MAVSSRDVSAPWNFSWVVENQLAAMACPSTIANLDYLFQNNIRHLITLSREFLPPIKQYKKLCWTLIHVDEFRAPALDDMQKFIGICEESLAKNEAVGVHCRQGKGRTGVMAACFLVKFQNLSPDRAIVNLRLQRPGSIETYEQEKAVFKYCDYLRENK